MPDSRDNEAFGPTADSPWSPSESSTHDDSRHDGENMPVDHSTDASATQISTPTDTQSWTPAEISLMVSSILLITLAAFEGLATTTIMPNVVKDFHAESWFSVASGAALAAQLSATVVAGALADWRGPRTVLFYGIGLFAVGLFISAFSPAILIFVIGRIIQGLGVGFVIVPFYVLVGSVASDQHRPAYFAAFSLAWVFPSLIGPAIAGTVATHIGWRPVFWAVPVLALIALLPMLSVLRQLTSVSRPAPTSLRTLTVMGLFGGLGVVLLQLSGALSGWRLFAIFLVGVVMTGWAIPRLLPHGTIRAAHGVPAAISTRFLAMGVQAGVGAFLPLVLQRVHGWEADLASLPVTLGSVSWSIGAVIQARVKDPDLRGRLPRIGTALMAIGVLTTITLLWPTIPVWVAFGGWVVASAGVGLMHSTLSVLALGQAPQEEHGKVSSWLQVADSAGSAIVLALVSILMAAWMATGVTGGLAYLPASLVAIVVAVLSFAASLRISKTSTSRA
ncbi:MULTISPECIES: MFS transporter [unclassified Schaalia]|uniref:MFS transporter n=1 Tax=unclassified Schaalia TaxID=2691889 RepID=UPI001E58184D|nr:MULTISPECIES: MFS transporter [unclassified Schaalia]